MRELLQQLEHIELKIKDLADSYSAALAENRELQNQNKSLTQDLEKLQESNEVLRQQIREQDLMARSKPSLGDDERKQIRRDLGQYIKEIDKCIEMMREV